MRRALCGMLLLLAACDQLKHEDSTELALRSGEQSAELAELRGDIADMKRDQQDQANLLRATSNAQSATFNEVESLRDTFNKNVKIDNDRNTIIVQQLNTLNCRAGISCGS